MNELLNQCVSILGEGGVLTGPDVSARAAGWGRDSCQASAILRPRSSREISAILKLCRDCGQAVVPQGGKTGKVDGCIAGPREFAISLERMNRILELDLTTRTISVEAGTPLQRVQEAAEQAGLYFPLDLGARGSATIGGNIATNAGGNRVLRYGMMRQLVLGLEAVLASGDIVSSMGKILKNNAGYDLKQLFIGTEGTLGIVSRAVLRLTVLPAGRNTVLAACQSMQQVQQILEAMERQLGAQLSAFEVMWRNYYQQATNPGPSGLPSPLDRNHPFYLLIETMGTNPEQDQRQFEALLTMLMEQGLLIDAVLPKSERERLELWAVRDNVSSYLDWRPVLTYDISLPLSHMQAHVTQIESQVHKLWPAAKFAAFGHLGDGNVHLAIAVDDDSQATRHTVDDIVYAGLGKLKGSVSAEHGIGLSKRDALSHCRSQEEIDLMYTLKQALDPHNILNPGKVLPLQST